jgi:mRNA interferase HigB
MKIVGRELLLTAGATHADAKQPLAVWLAFAEQAAWTRPHDIKQHFPSASILSGHRLVFNIKGNTYRLVVQIAWRARVVRITWFGTHAEYDKLKLS